VRIVDASGLKFCDVAGVRALVSATNVLQLDASPLTVVGFDGLLARILAVTGVLDQRVLQLSERGAGA
jgi:anti-anti-sigma regulatory factor